MRWLNEGNCPASPGWDAECLFAVTFYCTGLTRSPHHRLLLNRSTRQIGMCHVSQADTNGRSIRSPAITDDDWPQLQDRTCMHRMGARKCQGKVGVTSDLTAIPISGM